MKTKVLIIFWLIAFAALGQTTFMPTKAVSRGSHGESTSGIDMQNLEVYDYVSGVKIQQGNQIYNLVRSSNDKDVYVNESPLGVGTTSVEIVAYRSPNTRKIHLVICTIYSVNETLEIHFKPMTDVINEVYNRFKKDPFSDFHP